MQDSLFDQLKAELLAPRAEESIDELDAGAGDTVTIIVEGTPVLLVRTPGGADGEQAMLCADCGDIPVEQQAGVLKQVMTMNLLVYRDIGATFCTNPVSGHLLLLGRVDLKTATADGVRKLASQFAKGVCKYQRDRFDTAHVAAQTPSAQEQQDAGVFMRI